MRLAIRQNIAAIADYVPGRSSDDSGFAKLSSNENPFDPLPSVSAALKESAFSVNRYPDNDARRLRMALAAFYRVAPESIALGCGSIGLLRNILLTMADPGDEVIFGDVSFEAYPILCAQVGAKGVQVPLMAHALDLDAFADSITSRTKVILVCNPNNPTGTIVTQRELESFLDRVPQHILVVIDEAYFEYAHAAGAPDGRIYALERSNVVTLRSMSKAFGLAALRVGYAIAQPDTITLLNRSQLPFDVNALAQKAAIVSIDSYDELIERVEATASMRLDTQIRLSELGMATPPSYTNFLWLPLQYEASRFFDFLMSEKVIARLRVGHGVRVSIGSASENDQFIRAAEKFLRTAKS